MANLLKRPIGGVVRLKLRAGRTSASAIVTLVAAFSLMVGMNCDAVLDITPPRVKIVTPTDGDSVKGNTLVHVEADDNGLSKLQLYLDDSLIATASQSPLEVTAELDTSLSKHRLRAVAYDRGGNWSEARATVVRLVPRVSLTMVGAYGPNDWAKDLAVSGQYAYVAYNPFLAVLSLANPAAPVEVGIYVTGGDAGCDVHVAGKVACVADHGMSPVFVDVSNPQLTAFTQCP